MSMERSTGDETHELKFIYELEDVIDVNLWGHVLVINGDNKPLAVICSPEYTQGPSRTKRFEYLFEKITEKLCEYAEIKPKIEETIWIVHYTADRANNASAQYFLMHFNPENREYTQEPVSLELLSRRTGYSEKKLTVSGDVAETIQTHKNKRVDIRNLENENEKLRIHLSKTDARLNALEQDFCEHAKKQDVKTEIHRFSQFWTTASNNYYKASNKWFITAIVLASILVAAFFSCSSLQMWIERPVIEQPGTEQSKIEQPTAEQPTIEQPGTRDHFYPANLGKAIILSTLLIWGIRIATKGGMTAIHLARKAAEKATVADVYISLLSAASYKMTENDVAIIFNFLFSEAKTGLFKDEGPSLPLDIFVNTLRNATSPKT